MLIYLTSLHLPEGKSVEAQDDAHMVEVLLVFMMETEDPRILILFFKGEFLFLFLPLLLYFLI